MLGRVYAVAINTYREAVRDRVLYGVLGCAAFVLLFSLALGELSLNHNDRVVMDIGMASISIFSVVVAVFLGSSLLYKEIERRTLYVILPKPIHRWEFLVGKYMGIVLTAWVFIAIMGAIQLGVASTQSSAAGQTAASGIGIYGGPILLLGLLGLALARAKDRALILVPWSFVALCGMGAVAHTSGLGLQVPGFTLLLIAVEVAVVAGVAMLFSSFSTPFLTGLFTIGVWVLGRQADQMESISVGAVGPELKMLLTGMSKVVPNFSLFYPGRSTLTEQVAMGGPLSFVGTAVAYGALYTVITLVIAALIFRRRDFL